MFKIDSKINCQKSITTQKSYIRRLLNNKTCCDIFLHRESALSKSFVNISKEELNKAKKMDNIDAAKYYYDLITKSMAIPKTLRPRLLIEKRDKTAPRLSACYNWSENTLTYFSEKNKNSSKLWIFGLIRHELEHFRQNIDIYRNKETFKSLCKFYEELCQKQNLPNDELQNIISILEKNRKQILEFYPETDKNSKNYKKTKSYLDSQLNYNSYNYKTLVGMIKYFIQPIEFDACKVQGFNWINYIKTSLFG